MVRVGLNRERPTIEPGALGTDVEGAEKLEKIVALALMLNYDWFVQNAFTPIGR